MNSVSINPWRYTVNYILTSKANIDNGFYRIAKENIFGTKIVTLFPSTLKSYAMEITLLTSQIAEYSPSLKSFALNFTRDVDDAEDLYQDTMLKAVRYFEKFQEGTNLKAWLFTIMRNTYINNYRKMIKKRAVVLQEEELNSAQLLGSAVVNAAAGKFAMHDINIALQKIVPEYRYTFIRYFEGYKYHEIAEELGIPIGTVKTRIHITRLQLKKHLKAYGV